MSTGIEIIAAERERQESVEGYWPSHDDSHTEGQLAIAAAAYARPGWMRILSSHGIPAHWPWEDAAWKPSPDDRVRELAKAGALIAAEIDRIRRAE